MPFPSSIPAPLARALAARDYLEPTAVQAAVLEPAYAERDLLVSAQTGSGKTIAFGLAIAAGLLGPGDRLGNPGLPLALAIAPTRELALQVQRELDWLFAEAGAVVAACVGGMDPRSEARRLTAGTHIVVGTPGRLRDHLERGRLDLGGLCAVILDEADEMLDLGFREDLEFILEQSPLERRTLLFSATLPKAIVALAQNYQRDAQRITVATPPGGHADIEYRAMRVMPHELEHAVVNTLRDIDAPCSIVFCNTRESVRHLYANLQERGFSTVALSGELTQSERNRALQALRDKRARVCIATDVAARGIDLPDLGLVIHAELPHDAEALQHRSGRTGRAGRKGISVVLVPRSRLRRAERLLAEAKVSPEWCGPPTAETIRKRDRERLAADPLLTDVPEDDAVEEGRALLESHSAEHIAAALVRLYQSQLPAIEEVADPGFRPEVRPERSAPGERSQPQRRADHDGGGSWFRLDIGRANNADPRRLLPMLCRRGNIGREDIGAIRIFDRETKVEIRPELARHFEEHARQSEGVGAVKIERLGTPGHQAPRREKPSRDHAPARDHAPPSHPKPKKAKHRKGQGREG